MADLLKWRDEFPILQRTTYLISNSLGAMPRAVYERMTEYAQAWDERGVRAWEETWWDLAAKVGERLGAFLGAEPGTISLHQNVTLTQAVITSCFEFREPRNKVVMVDLEFPSIVYFYQEQRRRGAQVEMVKSEDGIRVPLEKLLAAIDEHTLLVPVSYVLFRSACIQDARAIIERAHQVGAHVVLDVYQAAGTIPVNFSALEIDFGVGGVLKWLCGGPGVAYLYVRPDLRAQLAPSLTGWMAHQRPFNFEVGPIDRRDDAFRFMNGTPQVPALYACQPGIEIVSQIGIERIREKSIRQTERLIEGALERGWHVNTPRNAAERAGTVSVDCPHAQEVMRELVARDILVDYRPKAGIRLSPHFYNRDEDIDLALEQIGEILSTRSWARHFQAV
jgi:kynureninase